MAPQPRARAPALTTGKRDPKSQTGALTASNEAPTKKRKGNRILPGHKESGDGDGADVGSQMGDAEGQSGTGIEESDMNETETNAAPGSICGAKSLYRTQLGPDGEYTWTTKHPNGVQIAAVGKETARYALLVRHTDSPDSRGTPKAASISIQSPWLRKQLSEIFSEYPGVNCEMHDLEFKAPFKPFVHRWNDFQYACQKRKGPKTTKQHMNLLRKVLEEEIGDKLQANEDSFEKGVVAFDDLWILFEPFTYIFSTTWDRPRAYDVVETEYVDSPCGRNFKIKCASIVCDGVRYGRVHQDIEIPEFAGAKPINSLKAYPPCFHTDQVLTERALMARGKHYEDLAGTHYKFYSGECVNWNIDNEAYTVHVASNIVVDPKSFSQVRREQEVLLDDLTAQDLKRLREVNSDQDIDPNGMDYKLSPYHHIRSTDRTYGYCLELKSWVSFFTDRISEIEWDENALERLVLPDAKKELVMSLCESQLAHSLSDDVITDKGTGVVCLLSGPSGVGKTLTAETVADYLRVPLYSLSSDSLGTDVGSVENALETAMELARRWKAILLLEGCDMFLDARSLHDLERNGVVCAFLRALEHYEGIVFMTANRVGNMDPAVKSRIHIELRYDELSFDTRKLLWQHLLQGDSGQKKKKKQKGKKNNKVTEMKTNVTEQDITELAEVELNGRQIKSMMKMASLLAAKDKVPLKRSHLDRILLTESRRAQ